MDLSGDESAAHARTAETLIAQLPTYADGATDWRGAGPYLRQHLAGHAVRGGLIDRLVLDPGFLLAVDPTFLLAALDAVSAAESLATAHACRRAMAYLRDDPGRAAAALQLAARRIGVEQLADRIGYRGGLPWTTLWTLLVPDRPHQTVAALPGGIDRLWTGRLPDATPVVGAVSRSGAYGLWTLPAAEVVSTGGLGRRPWPGHVTGFAGPSGRHFIAESVNGVGRRPDELVLWEVTAAAPVEVHRVGLGAPVRELYAAGEGTRAAFVAGAGDVQASGERSAQVRWWTVEGDPLRLVEMSPVPRSGNVRAAGYTVAGQPAVMLSAYDVATAALLSDPIVIDEFRDPQRLVRTAWTEGYQVYDASGAGIAESHHERYVSAVASTAGGLLCGGPDGVIRLWNVDDLARVEEEPAFVSSPVAAAAATLSNGRRVAVVTHDNGAVGVWDLDEGAPPETSLHRDQHAVAVACARPPGGPVLAVTVDQRGRVRVCDVDTGEARYEFTAPPADQLPGTGSYHLPGREPPADRGESLRDVAAAVTPTGQAIAVALGHNGWLHRWDMVTGAELAKTFFGKTAEAVRCAEVDGGALTVVATAQQLLVYHLRSGEPVAEHAVLSDERIWAMDIEADIVAAVDSGRRLHRWRLGDAGARIEPMGEPVEAHDDDARTISCGQLSNGLLVAVTGSLNGVVRVWDLLDGRRLHHIPIEDSVRVVALAEELFVGVDRGLLVLRLDTDPPAGLTRPAGVQRHAEADGQG